MGRIVYEPDWYARCQDCGGEVVFDAYATLDGEVWNTFEKDNLCTNCDGHNVQWKRADRDEVPPTICEEAINADADADAE